MQRVGQNVNVNGCSRTITEAAVKMWCSLPFKPLISKFKVFIVAPKHFCLTWRGPGLDLVPQTLKSGLWTRNSESNENFLRYCRFLHSLV